MGWAQHEIDFLFDYLKNTHYDNSPKMLFSDKRGYAYPAKWSEMNTDYETDINKIYKADVDCSYCRFRGYWKGQNNWEWEVWPIDPKNIDGYKESGTDRDLLPQQKADSSTNWNSGDDRTNFTNELSTNRYIIRVSNGNIGRPNYISGYDRWSYSDGNSSNNTHAFLISDRGDGYWKQAFILYRKKNDRHEYANRILYDTYNGKLVNQELLDNILAQKYYKNKGYKGINCKNENERFDDICKDICTRSSKDSDIAYNCNTGTINYSPNCANYDQRYDTDNCKKVCDSGYIDSTLINNCNKGIINYSNFVCRHGIKRYDYDNCIKTCDSGYTDSSLIENCNYGKAQWCNDYDRFKSSDNFGKCESSIEQDYTSPYTRFKDFCSDSSNINSDYCTNYTKNDKIYTKLYNDINTICDMSQNPLNYDKCKGLITKIDTLGDKFINWCKDNADNTNCNDLLNSDGGKSLRDRYDTLILNNICSSSDNIIKDSRCQKYLDSTNVDIKNKSEAILTNYCNNNSKTFADNPLDNPVCYRIANNKCLTATTTSDKTMCNNYYINIIKKLENTSDNSNNVLIIYYDDVNFKRLPINYQYIKKIYLDDTYNPKNLQRFDQAYQFDYYSAKIFAFVNPDVDGIYTFQIVGDDGVKFYINDTLMLDNYPAYVGTKETGSITLNKFF
jgi:hypothetical protein